MIKAILVFNNQGKPRISKFYVHFVSSPRVLSHALTLSLQQVPEQEPWRPSTPAAAAATVHTVSLLIASERELLPCMFPSSYQQLLLLSVVGLQTVLLLT